jgi:hypothetical protein
MDQQHADWAAGESEGLSARSQGPFPGPRRPEIQPSLNFLYTKGSHRASAHEAQPDPISIVFQLS